MRRLARLIAILLLLFIGRPAHADLVDWKSFDARLNDCDIVQVKIERNQINPNMIELVLESTLVSWKGLGVHASNGSYYEIGTGGGTHRDSVQLAAPTVIGAKFLQLGKQKYWLQHIGVYEIEDLRHLQGGDRVTFKWVQDYCPDLRGYVDPAPIPGWMKPGETVKVSLTAVPWYTYWHADQLLAIHFDAKFSVAARVIDQTVTFRDKLHWVAEITAPTTPGTYYMPIWINQLGGDSATLTTKQIVVSSTPPPSGSGSTGGGGGGGGGVATYVKVPNLIHQNLADGLKLLANLGLDAQVHDRDPSIPDSQQIITAQWPMAGSSARVGTRIALTVMPPGYSTLPIVNCDLNRATYHLWEYANDRWFDRAAIPAMHGDAGCPAPGQWFEHPLTHGQLGYFVIVDPTRCGANDPTNAACRAWEAVILGNAKGPKFPFAYVE